jgi:hypothetical protein
MFAVLCELQSIENIISLLVSQQPVPCLVPLDELSFLVSGLFLLSPSLSATHFSSTCYSPDLSAGCCYASFPSSTAHRPVEQCSNQKFQGRLTNENEEKSVAADDKVVPTTVAKRDWFLKASDLATLGRVGGGAAWGVGRFPTYYSVKDLDRLALRVHGGAAGLAKKKAARARRLENKAQKATKKKRPVVAPKPTKRESEEEIDASSGKRSAKK